MLSATSMFDRWSVPSHDPIRPVRPNRRDLVADELEHRFRNLLAVVDAITRQTLGSSEAGRGVAKTLSRRIAALASANDLIRAEPTDARRIGELVEAALTPFGDGSSGQISGGGPDMVLEGGFALALTMVLHELATNALKHGALSVQGGRVSLCWRFTGPAEDEFTFAWVESDGPKLRAPAGPQSFGLWMIQHALAPHVRATPEHQHRPEGVAFTFTARIPRNDANLTGHGRLQRSYPRRT